MLDKAKYLIVSEIAEVLQAREPQYEAASDIIYGPGSEDVEATVAALIHVLR